MGISVSRVGITQTVGVTDDLCDQEEALGSPPQRTYDRALGSASIELTFGRQIPIHLSQYLWYCMTTT